jgi:hypothetical protein
LYKQTQSAGAESAKQSQFAEPPGGLAASCTNKANSRHGAKTGKGFLGKDLWLIVQFTGLGKTKPIQEKCEI